MKPAGRKDGSLVRASWLLILALAITAALAGPAWSQGSKADLSRLVVIGDSISAGYLNSSLLDRQQVHGYASLVAEQARIPLSLPLIAAPGVPGVMQLISVCPLVIERDPGISPGRIDPFVQATNLSVPGQTVREALSLRPDFPVDSLTDLVLGLPGLLTGTSRSQVEWAEALAPTTMIVWLGSNDALWAMIYGDPSLLTPVPEFQAAYEEMMDRVSATGATIVVANIPDITVLPYIVPAEQVAAAYGQPLSVIGPILGIGVGDYVTLDYLPLVRNYLEDPTLGPLPGSAVLTADEIAVFQPTIDAYNSIIEDQARAKGAALVDIHTVLLRIRGRGVVVGGQRLTTEFLGGIFSLDGIHPTYTGHAILANEFIRALDTSFAAGIPLLEVQSIAQEDPLVLPGVGYPADALTRVKPDAAASLRSKLLHQ